MESIPENLTYSLRSPVHLSTYRAWKILLDRATESIDIAAMYWTLRGRDIFTDPTDWQVLFRAITIGGRRLFERVKVVRQILSF